jgi:hypothetical protein
MPTIKDSNQEHTHILIHECLTWGTHTYTQPYFSISISNFKLSVRRPPRPAPLPIMDCCRQPSSLIHAYRILLISRICWRKWFPFDHYALAHSILPKRADYSVGERVFLSAQIQLKPRRTASPSLPLAKCLKVVRRKCVRRQDPCL